MYGRFAEFFVPRPSKTAGPASIFEPDKWRKPACVDGVARLPVFWGNGHLTGAGSKSDPVWLDGRSKFRPSDLTEVANGAHSRAKEGGRRGSFRSGEVRALSRSCRISRHHR